MHQHFAIQWYEDQKRRREERYENGQVSILNRRLQKVLNQIRPYIDEEVYERQIEQVNRHLYYAHIWRIENATDLERKEVAVEQAVFISLILHLEESIENRHYLQDEVDRIMRQLGNFDWGMYGEYGRRKQYIYHAKKDALKTIF